MAQPQAAIFDLDGTLVDSLSGIASALNSALAEFSLPTWSEKTVISFIGNGSWQLVRLAIPAEAPDSLVDEIDRTFKRHYEKTWRSGTLVFPGAAALLANLVAAKIPIAVLSNKPHEFTCEIVAALFPTIAFDEIWGQRENFPKKPDPASALAIAKKWDLAPEKIAYVGDSDVDLATARNAGMQALIVAWGYNTPVAELRDLGWPLCLSMNELGAFF